MSRASQNSARCGGCGTNNTVHTSAAVPASLLYVGTRLSCYVGVCMQRRALTTRGCPVVRPSHGSHLSIHRSRNRPSLRIRSARYARVMLVSVRRAGSGRTVRRRASTLDDNVSSVSSTGVAVHPPKTSCNLKPMSSLIFQVCARRRNPTHSTPQHRRAPRRHLP